MKEAKRLRPLHDTEDAWYYENGKSVDVYAYTPSHPTQSCRITKRQLEQWLDRMKAGKK